MAERTNYEARIRKLEAAIAGLTRALRNVAEMARKALENSMRGGGDGGGSGNGNTVYAIVTTAVTGRTATNLGSGFARIDGDYNFTSGAVTAGAGTPVRFWSRWSGAVIIGDLVELDFRRGQWFLQGKDCGP